MGSTGSYRIYCENWWCPTGVAGIAILKCVLNDGQLVTEPFVLPNGAGLDTPPGHWTGVSSASDRWRNVLNGTWVSSSGRSYEVTNGSFVRDQFNNVELQCRSNLTTRSITSLFDCSGNWFKQAGEVGGGYRGCLYWDGGNQRWALKGQYNYQESPDNWVGHNYSQKFRADQSPSSLADAMAAASTGSGPPPARGIIDLQPVGTDDQPWARVLRGKWVSSSGKGYDVFNGDLWRGNYLNYRLTCEPDTRTETLIPHHRCGGDWFNANGEAGGRYRATMFWDGPNRRWALKGTYSYLENLDHWIGHNFSHAEGADGRPPALYVALTTIGCGGPPPASAIQLLQPLA